MRRRAARATPHRGTPAATRAATRSTPLRRTRRARRAATRSILRRGTPAETPVGTRAAIRSTPRRGTPAARPADTEPNRGRLLLQPALLLLPQPPVPQRPDAISGREHLRIVSDDYE